MRKTKIVCTLGPATDDLEVLESMIDEGMNVARFNFSHSNYDEHLRRLDELKQARRDKSRYVAALLDTKGPEIRVGKFKDGAITLKAGDEFTLTTREVEGTDKIGFRYLFRFSQRCIGRYESAYRRRSYRVESNGKERY